MIARSEPLIMLVKKENSVGIRGMRIVTCRLMQIQGNDMVGPLTIRMQPHTQTYINLLSKYK